MLKDAPSNYDAVYIDIRSVEVTMEGSSAFTITPTRPGIYNILNFKNGLDTLLVKSDIPSGKISQIRLLLGSNNSVVVSGVSYPVDAPSTQESGLKLNLDATLVANQAHDFWLDFDAGKSIVVTGNNTYKLKPVIRAYSALTDGRIKGYVLPAAALTTVYAVNGTDTFSTIPDNSGYYAFTGLPAGNYSVILDASVNNVNVTYGASLDLDTTVLVQ